MRRWSCWLALAILVLAGLWPATAAPPAADAELTLPAGGGLVDPAKQLSAEKAKEFAAACSALEKARGARLLVVMEPKPGSPRTAKTLLKKWPGAANDAMAAVLQVVLESRAADLALSASLSESLPDSARTQLLDVRVKPALSRHVADPKAALGDALIYLAGQLQSALPEPTVEAVKTKPLPPPPAPPLWLHPGWWLGLPVFLCWAILAARLGHRSALAYLPPLLLLFGGVYLCLRFAPLWLSASVPLALLAVAVATTQPAVSRAIRGVVVRCGGLGCTLTPQRRGGF